MASRGERAGGWVEKTKALRGADWHLQNSHGGVTYSTENRVNNVVITVYSARWVLEIAGGTLDCLTTMLCT